jgi:hypothetical protein
VDGAADLGGMWAKDMWRWYGQVRRWIVPHEEAERTSGEG